MEGFLDDLSNIRWWMSTVIVAILVNLASDYLKPRLDGWFARFSETRRQRIEEQERLFEQDVAKLLADPQEVISLKLDMITNILYAVLVIVLGGSVSPFLTLLIPGLIGVFLYVGSLILFLILAMNLVSRSVEARRLLRETEKRKRLPE